MDDLELRRTIYADPFASNEDISEACKNDPSKQQFIEEMQRFDKNIANALNVDVPESLCQRIILNQTLEQHTNRKRKNRIHLALAASVAFAAGISFSVLQSSAAYSDIGQHAIAHVYHEEAYFNNKSDARVTLASVNDKMSEYDVQFVNDIGELMSADFCRFAGSKTLHLTFKGIKDIVTVFVLPEEEAMAFVDAFSDEQLKGIATTANGHHLIIVGDKQEKLDDWQNRLNQNIQWSI